MSKWGRRLLNVHLHLFGAMCVLSSIFILSDVGAQQSWAAVFAFVMGVVVLAIGIYFLDFDVRKYARDAEEA